MSQEQKLELEQQNCNTPPITPTKTPQKAACPPAPKKLKQVDSFSIITDSLAGDEKDEVDSSLSSPPSSSDENWEVTVPPRPIMGRRLFSAEEEVSEARKIEAQKRFDEFYANQASKKGSDENNNNNITDGKKGTEHYSPSAKRNERRGNSLYPPSNLRNSFKRKRTILDELRLSACFYWLTMKSGATIKSESVTYDIPLPPKTTMFTFPLPADRRQENATTVDVLQLGAGFRMLRPRNPSNKESDREQKKGQIISTYVIKK